MFSRSSFILKLLSLFLTFASLSCWAESPLTKGSRGEKPLKVITFDYPPYMSSAPLEKGQGLEIDTLLAALKDSPFAMQFYFYPIKRAVVLQLEAQENGWPIYVGTAAHFKEQIEKNEMTAVQIGSGTFFAYVRQEDKEKFSHVKEISSLKNISVAAPRGSSVVLALQNKGIQPLEVSNFDQLFKVLRQKRVDVSLVLELAGEHYVRHNKLESAVKRINSPIYEITNDVVIPNKHPLAKDLIHTLRKGVERLKMNGELKEIAERYYGKGQVPPYFWNFKPIPQNKESAFFK